MDSLDPGIWVTTTMVFIVAALSAAVAVRFARQRIIDEVKTDIGTAVDVYRDRLAHEKEDTLRSSKVGRFRNRPPKVYRPPDDSAG